MTSRNVTLWQTFPQFKTKTGFKIRKNVRKKAYNKHIIIIVTWSGVQYHVSWMRLIHSTWYSTPDQVTVMIMCMSWLLFTLNDGTVWPETIRAYFSMCTVCVIVTCILPYRVQSCLWVLSDLWWSGGVKMLCHFQYEGIHLAYSKARACCTCRTVILRSISI